MLYVIATCKPLLLLLLLYWKYIKIWVKNWVATDPPLYNAYEAKLLNVLHSKLVKKKKSSLLAEWSTHSRTSLYNRKWSYYHGWPVPLKKKEKKIGLFSRATCPHTLKPGLFSGATCPHTHAGLFSQATYPFDWVNLRSHLAISFNPKQSRCVTRSTWNLIWRFPLTKAKLCVWLI